MKKNEEKKVEKDSFYNRSYIGLVIAILLIYILFNLFGSKPKSDAELKSERVAETEKLKAINNLKKCKKLEEKLNWHWTEPVSREFVELDCDSVIGASTREERVNEIRDAIRGY